MKKRRMQVDNDDRVEPVGGACAVQTGVENALLDAVAPPVRNLPLPPSQMRLQRRPTSEPLRKLGLERECVVAPGDLHGCWRSASRSRRGGSRFMFFLDPSGRTGRTRLRRRRVRRTVHPLAEPHDPIDPQRVADVGQRIGVQHDQVGGLARLDGAEVGLARRGIRPAPVAVAATMASIGVRPASTYSSSSWWTPQPNGTFAVPASFPTPASCIVFTKSCSCRNAARRSSNPGSSTTSARRAGSSQRASASGSKTARSAGSSSSSGCSAKCQSFWTMDRVAVDDVVPSATPPARYRPPVFSRYQMRRPWSRSRPKTSSRSAHTRRRVTSMPARSTKTSAKATAYCAGSSGPATCGASAA